MTQSWGIRKGLSEDLTDQRLIRCLFREGSAEKEFQTAEAAESVTERTERICVGNEEPKETSYVQSKG